MSKAPPRDKAIAIQSKSADEVPRVLASGSGSVAQQIVQLAEQHNIPIHEDSKLTDLLSRVPQGEHIPSESYQLVAEVLCFLYQLDAEWREEHKHLEPYFR